VAAYSVLNGEHNKVSLMNDGKTPNATQTEDARTISRRRALARLGIAAGIAYTAPTIVRLDRSANAKVLPSPCPPPGGGGKRPPGC
jgi:hypothetical protein